MDLTKNLTEKQKKFIGEILEKKNQNAIVSTSEHFKSILRTLLWNPAEIFVLMWWIFRNGPEQLAYFVIGLNWVTAILCAILLLIAYVVVDIEHKTEEQEKRIDSFLFDKTMLRVMFDPLATLSRYISNVLHVGIIILIAYAGMYIQALILFALFGIIYGSVNHIALAARNRLKEIENEK